MLKENDKTPKFQAKNQKDIVIDSNYIKGKKAIFYFYPKDDTPGCTLEGKDFSEKKHEFDKKNILIFGISKDSIQKHEKFCNKYNFLHDLLSDDSSTLCEDFGVWQEKSMMGKKYMGIVRSTFLINENGIIEKVWSPVKVKGHAEEVLSYC